MCSEGPLLRERPANGARTPEFVALVDYDNVKRSDDRSLSDAADNLDEILETLASTVAVEQVTELRVWVYGGWIDERGLYTQRADWLFSRLLK